MSAQVLYSFEVAGALVEAVLGDLTEERVDAIVNAANSHLAHGGGLAAAIVRRGGHVIQEESDRVAPVKVGGAAATTAGALPARWVVHAVGPRWGEGAEEEKLRSAVRSSLDTAAELGAQSVALPAISTGIFGYPKEEGTRTIVDEVLAWLQAQATSEITHVRLTAFDQPTAGLFAKALEERAKQEQ
ncbi:MAG: macro domain-containing protein [Acidobacteria bacterium]|jgi:O-acetyl-ADP-ribose deacetylase|nr:macro domain-containing protein [Acidobacteriota bacterium]